MRSRPSMPSSSRRSSANDARGRSERPYELTFWPSSVTSRTPSAARPATSATSSSCGRDNSRPRVDGTMQYEQTMLQPAEICTQPWKSRVRLAGAERDVDERELPEDLVLDGLRPAAPDADHALRVAPLERLGLVEVRDEARIGLLADRARVEEDQV